MEESIALPEDVTEQYVNYARSFILQEKNQFFVSRLNINQLNLLSQQIVLFFARSHIYKIFF